MRGFAAEAPAVEPVPLFDVVEFRVAGNTLLDRKQVESSLYPLLGAGKTVADVEAARQSLEQRYRDAGYPTVLVDIPEQDVVDGIVHLRVTESPVAVMRVTGARYFSPADIRAAVPALDADAVLHVPGVQGQLSALNAQGADRTVSPVLKPGRTPGTVEVELKVKDSLPLHGAVEVNDRSGADTRRWRASASLRYDNLWQRQHSLAIQYQTAPEKPDEVRVWSGTYVFKPGTGSDILALYAVRSRSNTAALGTLAVIGAGDIYGARWIVPLPGTEGLSHNVTLGMDYKDFFQSVVVQGADSDNTPIDYLGFSLQYTATLTSPSGSGVFNLGPGFGVRGFGNSEREFEGKRFLARPNYFYLRASAERTHNLPRGYVLYAQVGGQASGAALISNEQFSAGGADSVRGYYESQQLGDESITARIELRTPSFGAWLSERVQQLYAHTFWDGAALHVNDALESQDSGHELIGAGFGLRLTAWDTLTASLDVAQAFKDSGTVDAGDVRAHVNVAWTF